MIKHLFKLIWNKKKENFLLISEILVSFMVTFAVFSLLIYYYQNYKLPTGFKYENVWMVSLFNAVQPKDKDSITVEHDQLKMALLNLPKVKEVSYISGNAPFTHNTFGDNITYKLFSFDIDTYTADRDYEKLMGITILSGRWFNAGDKASAYLPIVLNASTAEKMNLAGKAVGKIVKLNGHQKKVIGVIQDLKDKGTFTKMTPGVYSLIDTSNVDYMNTILVKVAPDADARFEDKMYRLIANTTRSSNIQIQHLSEMQITKDKDILVPLIIFLVVAVFLIINVALGLFGVLWYNISKRRGEIGLRRAIGASSSVISLQLVGEALVLATFSLVVGSFFALQFPLLHVFDLPAAVYLTALLFSILFIYLLAIICALYPGRQAAAIHPAVALHED